MPTESSTIRIGTAQTQTYIAGKIIGNGAGLTGLTNLNVNMGNVTGTLPIANGGTGSATQNFEDLTTNQTIIGNKNFANFMGIGTSAPSAPLHIADLNGIRIGAGSGAFLTSVPSAPGDLWLGANMDSFKSVVNGAQSSWAWDMSLTWTTCSSFMPQRVAPAQFPL